MKPLLSVLLFGWLICVLACSGSSPDPGPAPVPQSSNGAPAAAPESAGPAGEPAPPDQPATVTIPPELDRTVLAELRLLADTSEARRKERVEQLRLEARRLRTRNRTKDSRTVSEQADRLEQSRAFFFDTIQPPYQPGQIGFLQNDALQVVSIVSSGELVGMIDYGDGDGDSQTVWLDGWDTTGVLTDSTLQVDGVVRVTGTREYTTVLGAVNRVAVLEPFHVEPYLPYVLPEGEAPLEVEQPELTPAELEQKQQRTAAAKLRLAKQLLEKDETEKGRQWLRDLIAEFPDTPSAAEAQDLLDQRSM